MSYGVIKSRLYKLEAYIVKRDFLLSFVFVAFLIFTGTFMGWYNNRVVPINPDVKARYTLDEGNHLSFLSNWDGPNYLRIAVHGYNKASTNFFPLYPISIRLVSDVAGSTLDAAILIAWLSFLGAVYLFLQILKHLFKIKDNAEAFKGLLLFALFPTAMFFLATYTESLFAFLALGAIYYTLKKRYLVSAIFLLFCGATHITGALVILLIGMMMWEEKEKIWKILATMAIGSLGLIAYSVYLWHKFRDPFGFILSQKGHGWFISSYTSLLSQIDLFNVIFILLILAAIYYWWNRRRSFAIYSFLFLLIPLLGKQFGGFNRYVLMVFPVQFMLFAYLRKKTIAYQLCLSFFAISWAYFILQYAGGYVGG
jgi:Gpi18-like mannosyltransferase